jgi:DUF4097 and DUF4098 domain-containing protein YvlB
MGKSRYLLILTAIMYCALCLGQKKSQEIIAAEGITSVRINSDEIFKIDVFTSKTDKITIKSGIAGETFETMRVNSEVKNGFLEITASRNPLFQDIDDKLAAHKVLSIVLEINIPENLEFWVDSSLAAVNMQGIYGLIELNLGRGDCRLDHFRGSGTINTLSGNINVNTQNCKIDASSRHGKENINSRALGGHHLELMSIAGNITVTQSE